MSYTKLPRGKRVMRISDVKTKEIVSPYATNEDLREILGFTDTDIKNLYAVMAGDTPSVKGYAIESVGVLRDF